MKTIFRYEVVCPVCKSKKAHVQTEDTEVNYPVNIIDGEVVLGVPKVDKKPDEGPYFCSNCGEVLAVDKEQLLLKYQKEYVEISSSILSELVSKIANGEAEEEDKGVVATYVSRNAEYLKEWFLGVLKNHDILIKREEKNEN